jgi:Fe-S-cluster-containing hydrogenase component 2
MDNCPLDAIDLSISPPVFASGMCRPCYFCEMICPEGAIEVDYVPLVESEMKQAKTIFNEALKKAETEGRFRRLVPLEKVGWRTPYYVVNNKHPRYVIPKE